MAAARNGYAFPTGTDAAEQFDALQTVLDPLTTARLGEFGIAEGARCWEAGAGGGSIARWLADTVGPTGLVVATDRDISRLHPSDNLHVLRHDLRETSIPPGGPFDVVHARLVLLHLRQRREIVHRLIEATKPGGWLLIEEFDCTVPLRVLCAPDDDATEVFGRYVDTLLGVLAAAGADLAWARHVHAAMTEAALQDVHTISHAESWTGGQPGCRLHETNSIQMQQELLAAGLTTGDLERLRALLRHPGFTAMSYQFVSTRGRRPLTTGVEPVRAGAGQAAGEQR